MSSILPRLADGRALAEISNWGGELVHLPSKADGTLYMGDILRFYPPGGGGWGDPLDREEELVLKDFKNGVVTSEFAGKLYGVVLTKSGDIDLDMTKELRDSMRRERQQFKVVSWPLLDRYNMLENSDDLVVTPIGAYGEINRAGQLRCRKCGTIWFGSGAVGVRQSIGPLSLARPWRALRWNGDSQRFSLSTLICPTCSTIIHVGEELKRE